MEKDRATPKLLKESPVDCKIAKCCGPLTLEETVETLKSEIEQLKEEITKLKEREYIFKFGLERFGSNSVDITFYTGFPNYDTLMAFWQYIEPNAANLTYYSNTRNVSEIVSNVPFPHFNAAGKKLLKFSCRKNKL